MTEVCHAVGYSSLGSFSSMITNISLLSLWVKDIEESLAFYTDVLGFAVGDDFQLGPDFRWTTVFHPRQPEIHLHLSTPSGPLPDYLIEAMNRAQDEGGLPGVGMNVDDCWATYEDLKAKGVEFLHAPEERAYGVEALMRATRATGWCWSRSANTPPRTSRARTRSDGREAGVGAW